MGAVSDTKRKYRVLCFACFLKNDKGSFPFRHQQKHWLKYVLLDVYTMWYLYELRHLKQTSNVIVFGGV